jgi:hypothetical protein
MDQAVSRSAYDILRERRRSRTIPLEEILVHYDYFDELTIRQTASVLGISVPTAQNILYRAREIFFASWPQRYFQMGYDGDVLGPVRLI